MKKGIVLTGLLALSTGLCAAKNSQNNVQNAITQLVRDEVKSSVSDMEQVLGALYEKITALEKNNMTQTQSSRTSAPVTRATTPRATAPQSTPKATSRASSARRSVRGGRR